MFLCSAEQLPANQAIGDIAFCKSRIFFRMLNSVYPANLAASQDQATPRNDMFTPRCGNCRIHPTTMPPCVRQQLTVGYEKPLVVKMSRSDSTKADCGASSCS